MSFSRAWILTAAVCAGVAWLAGPLGRFAVVLPLLLFGPGYLVERGLLRLHTSTAWARPALWLGFSLSSVALLYLWATTLGAALSATKLTVLALACGAGVLALAWRAATDDGRRTMDDGTRTGEPENRESSNQSIAGSPAHPFTRSPAHLALLALLALVFALRFEQIGDLALPPWVDSVHHALLIRIAAEHGQAPLSLRPYLPVDQLPYHWGYHVFLAAVMQLSGVSLPATMLWSGQVLNGLHVLTCAALAAYLWRRPWAGLVAGIVVGTLSIFPAYYLSWGRYTQLAGLLLLPPLAIAGREALRTAAWRWYAAVALLLAGLSLIHFRVLIFALCLLTVMAVVQAATRERMPWRAHARGMLLAVGLPLLLTAPWLWLLVTRTLERAAQSSRYVVNEAGSAIDPGLLWAGLNRWLVALALLAALWGLARRSRAAAEQISWIAGMLLLANPWLVGLPSLWLISNEAVIISLFVPISVMIGGGACWVWERATQGDKEWRSGGVEETRSGGARLVQYLRFPASPLLWFSGSRLSVLPVLSILALAGMALWGAQRQRSVVNPATVFATAADVKAIAWAAANTPPDARFLINATGWQPGSDRGLDGGWWLLPLAGRWTSTPPVLALYGSPDYVQAVQDRNQFIANYQPGQQQALWNLIGCKKINYVYLGTQPGALTREVFADRPGYRQVYDDDGVTILAVPQETCYDRTGTP